VDRLAALRLTAEPPPDPVVSAARIAPLRRHHPRLFGLGQVTRAARPPVKTAGQAVADPGRAAYNQATATGVRVADPEREEERFTPPSLSGRATSEKGCDCDHEALCRG